tara:strand:+ start:7044 stop:7313 length:270 start_codon:yes stop_codon:yes gene_type:complete
MYNMSESSNDSYVWNANDYSNIITIGASALASVLLVIFKSRCKTINLCCGLLSCNREVKDESEEENEGEQAQPPQLIPPQQNNDAPPNP